ncbi:TipAS antibiotic-recognition domain-containing protein, partial [Kribbella sp. NPDC002412]
MQEAEDRWGVSKQWAQYVEGTSTLAPDDWRAVAASTEALHAELAAAVPAGVVPGSAEANAGVGHLELDVLGREVGDGGVGGLTW